MPRCGATLDENIPLSGGASDSGRVAPMALGWVVALLGKPTPSACGSHPSDGGDFHGSCHTAESAV